MEVFRFLKTAVFFLLFIAAGLSPRAFAGNDKTSSGSEHTAKETAALSKVEAIAPSRPLAVRETKAIDLSLSQNLDYLAGRKRSFAQFEDISFPADEGESYEISETVSDSISALRLEAEQLAEQVESQDKYSNHLDGMVLLDLPIGLKKTIGNTEYTIMIKEAVTTEGGAFLEVFMSFKLPGNEEKLAFRGTGIGFTKEGGLMGENARLELVGDYEVKLSNNSTIKLFKGGTFVEWDCDGFKSFGIDAEVSFSRNWLIPIDNEGKELPGKVNGRITTTLSSWDDFIAGISLGRFQVKSLPDVYFKVNNAIFDFSDLRNPNGLAFPANYFSDVAEVNPNLWRGVYLQELEVTLPEYFNKRKESKQGTPNKVYISNAIIDKVGFTGIVSKNNLLTLEEGRMGKWAFSLDSLSLAIEANNLAGAAFAGGLIIPAFDDKKPFGYQAAIYPDNRYVFAVSSPKELSFSLLNAGNLVIREDSRIEVTIKDKKFIPKAILNGTMSIGKGDSSKFKLASISFEQLQIQPVTPYVRVGALSLGIGKKNSLGDFPVQINNFGIETPSDNEVGLRFDITVSLTGKEKNSFGATGGLVVMGKIEDGESWQRWKYDRLVVRKLGIAVDAGALKIAGSLEWYKNNPTYGDGIRGEVELEVIDKFKVEAVALFGTKDFERYWFVDALATVKVPIATGLQLNTIGGGAKWGMKQTTGGSNLGRTLSGLTYVPDKNMGMEFNAFVKLSTMGSEAIFNGEVQFRMAFNRHGGLDLVAFTGQAAFINPMAMLDAVAVQGKLATLVVKGAKAIPPLGAQIEASFSMVYDVPAKTFHANMEVYVNVLGLIKGIGERNRAGWSVIHFSPGEWYIHAGTPDDPVGLEFFSIARMESYFMMGHHIPGSPPPPKEVSEILGGVDLNYMSSLNELGEGKGIAFGSRFSINTGNISFLMFYGSFKAGMGFDIMLKDYGNARCKGSGELGINGWYANGQSFAYMEGEIGIKVKIFGKRKKFEILSISAAVILQAKLPNPTWMRGIVGGHFRILGGMVSGDCRFEVTIGKECELIREGSVLENVEVISDFTPKDGEKDVDVFSAPQVIFAMPVDKVFRMVDYDDENKTYRVRLDYAELRSDGQLIKGVTEWNDRHDVLAFNAHDVLPSEKTIDFKVKITFEQLISGRWYNVVVDGVPLSEEKQVSFTSGKAPDYIPLNNVEVMYPMVNQYNYYKDQTERGYIRLIKGQSYLFHSEGFVPRGRFRNLTGGAVPFNVSYDEGNKQVNFNLPKNLQNNAVYTFEIVNVPIEGNKAVDENVEENVETAAVGDGVTIATRSQSGTGNLERLEEKNIINFYLRSSVYNTFTAKMNALRISSGWRRAIRPGVHELGATVDGVELFDEFEKNGNSDLNTAPLLQFTAVLEGNDYYEGDVYPLLYKNYPFNGYKIAWRDTKVLGVAPVRGSYLRQYAEGIVLDENDVLAGQGNGQWYGAAFMYNLVHYYEKDYYDLQNQIAWDYAKSGTLSGRAMNILTSSFPKVRRGDYKLKIQYVLPGATRPSGEKVIEIYNPLD